jgi:hypothetical protein
VLGSATTSATPTSTRWSAHAAATCGTSSGLLTLLFRGSCRRQRNLEARSASAPPITLGALGRSEDAIAVYDDLLARFGTATELPLREPVAMAESHRKDLGSKS